MVFLEVGHRHSIAATGFAQWQNPLLIEKDIVRPKLISISAQNAQNLGRGAEHLLEGADHPRNTECAFQQYGMWYCTSAYLRTQPPSR